MTVEVAPCWALSTVAVVPAVEQLQLWSGLLQEQELLPMFAMQGLLAGAAAPAAQPCL